MARRQKKNYLLLIPLAISGIVAFAAKAYADQKKKG
jgi:hypothetical protein